MSERALEKQCHNWHPPCWHTLQAKAELLRLLTCQHTSWLQSGQWGRKKKVAPWALTELSVKSRPPTQHTSEMPVFLCAHISCQGCNMTGSEEFVQGISSEEFVMLWGMSVCVHGAISIMSIIAIQNQAFGSQSSLFCLLLKVFLLSVSVYFFIS